MRLRLAAIASLLALAAGAWLWQPWLTPRERLARRSEPTGVKVVIVGIDGATFRVMDPLIAQGKLPNFKRLIDAGARTPLQSENPMLSPALWTTIATGHSREAHGITDFVTRSDPQRPNRQSLVASSDRKTLALWNLASGFGRGVGFIGWWATWPAEPVSGFMISDRFTRDRWNALLGGRKQEHKVFPEALQAELTPLIVDPADPPMDEIAALVSLTREEQAELKAAKRPVFGHGLSVFKFAYCSQRSYEKMALQLLAKGQPDLLGLFLVANDPVSHCFWHFFEPEAFPAGVDPQLAARLGVLIPNFYVHNDAFLGELLAKLDKDTVVLIVSDHGFEASRQLPALKPAPEMFEGPDAERAALNGMIAVGQSGKHQIDGVLIAAGGPIRRGATAKAGIRDIAPTVLALLGLPVPRDMGRVLKDLFEPAFLARHPITRIATYETLIDHQAVRAAAEVGEQSEAEKKELLRSLGYIQ